MEVIAQPLGTRPRAVAERDNLARIGRGRPGRVDGYSAPLARNTPVVDFPIQTPVEFASAYLEQVAALEFVAPARVGECSLDVGGWNCLLPCAERGYEAHAALLSQEVARNARGELFRRGIDSGRIRYFQPPSLPHDDGSLALITCLGGLPARLADRQALLDEFSRLLMPGGILVASVRQHRAFSASSDGAGFLSQRGTDPNSLCGELAAHRLECERQGHAVCLSTANLGLMVGDRDAITPTRMERLASLDREMRELFPNMKGQVFLVLARKAGSA